jgi:hypothetical protein
LAISVASTKYSPEVVSPPDKPHHAPAVPKPASSKEQRVRHRDRPRSAGPPTSCHLPDRWFATLLAAAGQPLVAAGGQTMVAADTSPRICSSACDLASLRGFGGARSTSAGHPHRRPRCADARGPRLLHSRVEDLAATSHDRAIDRRDQRAARAAAANGPGRTDGNGAVAGLVFLSRRAPCLSPATVAGSCHAVWEVAGLPGPTPKNFGTRVQLVQRRRRAVCADRRDARPHHHDVDAPAPLPAPAPCRQPTRLSGSWTSCSADGTGQPASADSRERMKSASASAETSRREPRRNDSSSPDRRKR